VGSGEKSIAAYCGPFAGFLAARTALCRTLHRFLSDWPLKTENDRNHTFIIKKTTNKYINCLNFIEGKLMPRRLEIKRTSKMCLNMNLQGIC